MRLHSSTSRGAVWVLALLAVALLTAPRHVEWGEPFNPSLAAAWVGLLLRAAFWLWLVLLLLPAVVGWALRRLRLGRGTPARSGRRPDRGAWVGTSWWSGASRRGDASAQGATVWPRSSASAALRSFAPIRTWQPGSPPAFLRLDVAPLQVTAGQPVTVSWEAPEAEHVVLGDATGLPACGTTVLVPVRSGPLQMTAVNRHGTSSALTQAVEVRRAARVDLTPVPGPPHALLPTAPPAPAPVPDVGPRLRLDVVTERQRARRSTPRPPVPGAALPAVPLSPSERSL